MLVVRVEEAAELVGPPPRRLRVHVVALRELGEVHLVGRVGLPEAEAHAVVRREAVHRGVVGLGLVHVPAEPAGALPAGDVGVALRVSVEAHSVGHVLAGDLEAVAAREPVVRHL